MIIYIFIIMFKSLLTVFSITITIALAGCDYSQNTPNKSVDLNEKVTTVQADDSGSVRAVKTLNLNITDEMIKTILPDEDSNYEYSEHQLINLNREKSTESMKIRGKASFGEIEIGSVPSIDGGRIDLEIPFNN